MRWLWKRRRRWLRGRSLFAAVGALALLGVGVGLGGAGGVEELLGAAMTAWELAGVGGGERGVGGGELRNWGAGLTDGGAIVNEGGPVNGRGSIDGRGLADEGGQLLAPPPCGPSGPFLLIMVASAPSHVAQRQAIRDTWGGGRGWDPPLDLPTRTLFVLGVPEDEAGGGGVGRGSGRERVAGGSPRGVNGGMDRGTTGGFSEGLEGGSNVGVEEGLNQGVAGVAGGLGVGSSAGPAAGGPRWSLAAESRRFGDLLQGPFADSYPTLVHKTLFLLRWAAARCPGASFVLKADDDVFVNLPALTGYLRRAFRSLPPLYLGRVHWRVPAQRDPRHRHHVPPALYSGSHYPPYCSGTSYVLSALGVRRVLAVAPGIPLAGPEDVWVGLVAQRAGLAPQHSARMAGALRVPLDGCCYREVMFSSHHLTPQELRRVWGLLKGEECSEVQRLLGVLRCKVMGEEKERR